MVGIGKCYKSECFFLLFFLLEEQLLNFDQHTPRSTSLGSASPHVRGGLGGS